MDQLVSGARQLRRVLFQKIQSNVSDLCLDEGLAKIADLQLLSNQNHSNI